MELSNLRPAEGSKHSDNFRRGRGHGSGNGKTAGKGHTKTGAGGTDKVWFYDMKADGFSLDDKRSEIADNDIPDIIQRFHHLEQEATRERTEQSFFVPKQEIVDNGYDLSINKYKKMEYVAEEYPSTDEILSKIEKIEQEIVSGLAELRSML